MTVGTLVVVGVLLWLAIGAVLVLAVGRAFNAGNGPDPRRAEDAGDDLSVWSDERADLT